MDKTMVSSISRPVRRSGSSVAASVAMPVKGVKGAANKSNDTWGTGYVKGGAPSRMALEAEANFKELCLLTAGFKVPQFLQYNPKYFWNKVKGDKQYLYMVDRIQEGMQNSHPGVDLKTLFMPELVDFVLGIDVSVLYKFPHLPKSCQMGFDVTCNPLAPPCKCEKLENSYRGNRKKLIQAFGYDRYIPVLWSVTDFERRDKRELSQQLVRGLSGCKPNVFTHIIEIK